MLLWEKQKTVNTYPENARNPGEVIAPGSFRIHNVHRLYLVEVYRGELYASQENLQGTQHHAKDFNFSSITLQNTGPGSGPCAQREEGRTSLVPHGNPPLNVGMHETFQLSCAVNPRPPLECARQKNRPGAQGPRKKYPKWAKK